VPHTDDRLAPSFGEPQIDRGVAVAQPPAILKPAPRLVDLDLMPTPENQKIEVFGDRLAGC